MFRWESTARPPVTNGPQAGAMFSRRRAEPTAGKRHRFGGTRTERASRPASSVMVGPSPRSHRPVSQRTPVLSKPNL